MWDDLMMAAREARRGPFRHAKRVYKALLRFRLPVIRPIAAVFYAERGLRQQLLPLFLKIVYREPMLRYRCETVGAGLDIQGPLPFIMGNGRIVLGREVLLLGKNTWVVGFKVSEKPELIVEDKAGIGYGVTISVATQVRIGPHAMIASDCMIFDNPGHPISPEGRLKGESFTLGEAAPVTIEKNAWIGSGSIVLKGVTIGENSIVAAGSVVTKSIPPNVLAGGNPARVIRSIADEDPDDDVRRGELAAASGGS